MKITKEVVDKMIRADIILESDKVSYPLMCIGTAHIGKESGKVWLKAESLNGSVVWICVDSEDPEIVDKKKKAV